MIPINSFLIKIHSFAKYEKFFRITTNEMQLVADTVSCVIIYDYKLHCFLQSSIWQINPNLRHNTFL